MKKIDIDISWNCLVLLEKFNMEMNLALISSLSALFIAGFNAAIFVIIKGTKNGVSLLYPFCATVNTPSEKENGRGRCFFSSNCNTTMNLSGMLCSLKLYPE